ncbi:hypothetical protein CRG98_004252 [Punica granatum]|uniref:Uncharacterized protein n=1 Tax=Punica granatum TaxID=22663 RepID=A0A2I0L3T6_PUNGR|nr:hypothetical protein CRG98_004252 [Punica granatum]
MERMVRDRIDELAPPEIAEFSSKAERERESGIGEMISGEMSGLRFSVGSNGASVSPRILPLRSLSAHFVSDRLAH